MSVPTFGFIILRHVRHRVNDLYWKESYRCIRRWYPDAPILIIDDSSVRDVLNEDLIMTKCTVIYDTMHRGAAELLPYYYFHLLRPFERAVIMHDGVFLHGPIEGLDRPITVSNEVRWLWSIPHTFNDGIAREIYELMADLPGGDAVRQCYLDTSTWHGAFGVMSVITWDLVDRLNVRFSMFDHLLGKLKNREYRSALERVFGVLVHQLRKEAGIHQKVDALHGGIMQYISWGVSFQDYLMREDLHDARRYPLMKVWSGR